MEIVETVQGSQAITVHFYITICFLFLLGK